MPNHRQCRDKVYQNRHTRVAKTKPVNRNRDLEGAPAAQEHSHRQRASARSAQESTQGISTTTPTAAAGSATAQQQDLRNLEPPHGCAPTAAISVAPKTNGAPKTTHRAGRNRASRMLTPHAESQRQRCKTGQINRASPFRFNAPSLDRPMIPTSSARQRRRHNQRRSKILDRLAVIAARQQPRPQVPANAPPLAVHSMNGPDRTPP